MVPLSYWLVPVVMSLSYWLVPVGLLDGDKGSCPAVRLLPEWLPILMVSKLAQSSREYRFYLDWGQYWYCPYWYFQCEQGHQIVRIHT